MKYDCFPVYLHIIYGLTQEAVLGLLTAEHE